MATATPKPAGVTDELLLLLGDSELPLAEVVAKTDPLVLARAWAAGDIEFGTTKHVTSGAPHAGKSNLEQIKGKTLIIETGVEWTGPKTKSHGPAKAVVADAKMPDAKFYQHYRLEVKTSADPDVWQLLPVGDDPGARETRNVRMDITKEQAAKLFGHFVKLTDKGLSQLQTA